MPWNEVNTMSLREEFLELATSPQSNISELCRRFKISRKTAYKWMKRNDLNDLSRRPLSSPNQTPAAIEILLLETRLAFPEWGGRKLKRYLENQGHQAIPAASTITDILRRHDLLQTSSVPAKKHFIRFEHEHPNDLWQMDFKGPIPTATGSWNALTVLDDHSRFSLGIQICRRQTYGDTQSVLIPVFKEYGVPKRMTMDNGNPWGVAQRNRHWTKFAIWLMDLGITVSHSTPLHPQTQGKDERFHRSLKYEVLNRHRFLNGRHLQRVCDTWRTLYNEQRPHEALGLDVPADHYQPSSTAYKAKPGSYEYDSSDIIRSVHTRGDVRFKGKTFNIGVSFYRKAVALRETKTDGCYDVYYRHQKVARIDLRTGNV